MIKSAIILLYLFLNYQAAFCSQINFSISGHVDSIILHFEDLRYCTNADTIDSCEVVVGNKYYKDIQSGFKFLEHDFFDMGNCCGERRFAYLEIKFKNEKKKNINTFNLPMEPLRIYLWDCNLYKGYIYLNDNLFTFKLSNNIQKIITDIIAKHKIRVLTAKGINKIIRNRKDIMVYASSYLSHINEFDEYRIDMIEQPLKQKDYQMPEASLVSLKDFISRFKKDMSELGLIAIWDTSNNEYLLKWKDSIQIK